MSTERLREMASLQCDDANRSDPALASVVGYDLQRLPFGRMPSPSCVQRRVDRPCWLERVPLPQAKVVTGPGSQAAAHPQSCPATLCLVPLVDPVDTETHSALALALAPAPALALALPLSMWPALTGKIRLPPPPPPPPTSRTRPP